MEQLLIVEDDIGLNQGLCKALKADARQIISCQDLKTAKEQLLCGGVSLILLDINLPDGSGLELLRTLRQNGSFTPAILLTANDLELDEVTGLEAGADDYITKPFGTEELLARIRAVLRSHRHSEEKESSHGGKFRLQDLLIDYDTRQVFVGKEEIDLTQTEYNIMAFLSVHAGKVLTYAAIIRAVWGYSDYGSVKKLQVNMKNIRKKMGVTPGEKRYIINELGVGYRMLAEDEA